MNFKFNSLIPELIVSNIEKSLNFYKNILLFEIIYLREKDGFCFLEYYKSQIMIEQKNDNWITGELTYPFGRGINLQIKTNEINRLIDRVKLMSGKTFFRSPFSSEYETKWGIEKVREFLIQDPDGYLLRFSQEEVKKNRNLY